MFAAFFEILGADVGDEGADEVDVVGKHHAADGLDEDETEGLLVAGGGDVAEADGEHDVDGPVVGPDVDLVPGGGGEGAGRDPVAGGVDRGHELEQQRQEVRVAEVEDDQLHQRPVTLLVRRLDQARLQPLQPVQNRRNLE